MFSGSKRGTIIVKMGRERGGIDNSAFGPGVVYVLVDTISQTLEITMYFFMDLRVRER